MFQLGFVNVRRDVGIAIQNAKIGIGRNQVIGFGARCDVFDFLEDPIQAKGLEFRAGRYGECAKRALVGATAICFEQGNVRLLKKRIEKPRQIGRRNIVQVLQRADRRTDGDPVVTCQVIDHDAWDHLIAQARHIAIAVQPTPHQFDKGHLPLIENIGVATAVLREIGLA